MAKGHKIGGVIQLTADTGEGAEGLPIMGDFEVEAGGIKRELVFGQDGLPHGWIETVIAAKITGKLVNRQGVDWTTLFEMTNGTVQLTLAPTLIFHLSGAVYTGPKSFTTNSGAVAFEAQGTMKIVRITS